MNKKILALALLGAMAFVPISPAPTGNPFPITNGVLTTNLNANGKQILNLDTGNLGLSGGIGIDTGVTTAILKGNGAHGIADAVAGTDYLAPTGSGLLLTGVVLTANNLSDLADAATARDNLVLGNVDDTSDADKPVSTATATALVLKADAATVTSALALKADDADLVSGLAAKEDTLPTTANDGYILARDIDDNWHFVDPATLGTTSQTFTDGVENTTTTLTSATANFVAGDVGKTITGDNIDPGTTIASRTNSTTVVLSQAATATGSGNTFTILNRLEVGGTGTVTSIGVTNNASTLLTIGLANPTTSAALTFSAPVVGANTFYGNGSAFTTTPGFMTAATARTSLGLGTMALQANTGTSVTLQKGNGTGGFTAGAPGTDYLLPTGSGTGLTGVLKTANNLSDVTPSAARTNLGLAVVASTGSFFDLTAPTVGANTFYGNQSGVTGSAAFMSAAAARTALSLGTGISTELVKGDGAGGTTPATANQDYAKNTTQIGTNASTPAWASGITNFIEGAALTANRTRTLPPTSAYADGTTIKYLDSLTTGNFGPLFVPAGADTLKTYSAAIWASSSPPGYLAFTGAGFAGGTNSITFQKRGTDWRIYNIGGETLTTSAFRDQSDKTRYVQVDVHNQQPSANWPFQFNGNAPTGPVVDLATTDHVFITGYDLASNSLIGSTLYYTNILNNVESIATDTTPYTVTADGSKNEVLLTGSTGITHPMTIYWPPASAYSAGEEVKFIDVVGSINSTNTVTVTSAGTDTFNGASTIVFNGAGGNETRFFHANPASSPANWSVSNFGGSNGNGLNVGGFGTLTDHAPVNWVCDPSLSKQKKQLTLTGGIGLSREVIISGARDGEEGELWVTHGQTNDTLTIANGGNPNNGLSVIDLSTAAGAVDRINWILGPNGKFALSTIKNTTWATAAACNDGTGGASGASAASSFSLGNTSASKYFATRKIFANGICRIDVSLFRNNFPAGTTLVNAYLYTDGGSGPGTVVATSPTNVNASQITPTTLAGATAAPTRFDFGTVASGTYYVVLSLSTINGSNFVKVAYLSGGSSAYSSPSALAGTWVTNISGAIQFTAYH